MIKFKEKSIKKMQKIVKYYTDRGFVVSVVLINNWYQISISEYKSEKSKKVLTEG